MEKTDFNISFIVHDIKNNIGAAISHIQLAIIKHPNIENDNNVAASIDALKSAIDLARDIAVNVKNDETDNPDVSSSEYTCISVNEHINSNTKPFLRHLKTIYPEVEINHRYKLTNEIKFIEVNSKSLNRAMENIVVNAVNAGASKIDIHSVMREYCLVATVHDNGSGMTSEEIDKVMLSLHGDGEINGIGTRSILKTAVDHKFHLSYSSTEGEGTTIKVLVPYINA